MWHASRLSLVVSLSASTLSGPPKQRPFDHKVGLAIMVTE